MTRVRCLRAAILLACIAVACGKTHAAAPSSATSTEVVATDGAVARVDAGPVITEDPLTTDLWAHAADGDADDLARLCDALGSDALIDASPLAARRLTALRALAYDDDFTALPFLAKIATSGTDEEAAAAMDSAAFVAARPRRAIDPDDALELHDGAQLLLTLAKDATRPPARRVLAIRVLRLLDGRDGVARADIPTELDAR